MSMPPLIGGGEFRDDILRIAELTVNTTMLENMRFSNCRIIGPAVLALLNDIELSHCRWDGDVNALFWEVPDSRPVFIGAVGVRHCTFSNCRFENVGIAGPPGARAIIEAGFDQ